jgi:hypothetical protein
MLAVIYGLQIRRMGSVAWMQKVRNAYKILVGKSEGQN